MIHKNQTNNKREGFGMGQSKSSLKSRRFDMTSNTPLILENPSMWPNSNNSAKKRVLKFLQSKFVP